MDPIIILHAGIASGTVLLFATLGELLTERSGVLNLGVEGMMLIGAMTAFSLAVSTGNGWMGVAAAMFVAGLLALLHGVVTIHFQADQVVSGLALTFLGVGLSLVFGEGLSQAGTITLLPRYTIPVLSSIPVIGPIAFTNQNILVYVGYVLVPAIAFYIYRTRPGMDSGRWVRTRPRPTPWVSTSIVSAIFTCGWADCWRDWRAPPSVWRSRRDGSAS